MADVIPFPTKAVRDWRAIEASIRAMLRDTAMPPDGTETVVARMKPFVELCTRDFSINTNYVLKGPNTQNNAAAVNEMLAQINEAFTQKQRLFVLDLLADRLSVEITLYWASEGNRPPDDA